MNTIPFKTYSFNGTLSWFTRDLGLLRLMIACFLLVLTGAPSAQAVDPAINVSQYAHTAWRVRDGFFNGSPNVIAQTTDGYVWIGTSTGLMKFDGVRFVQWTPSGKEQLLFNSFIYSLLGGSDGSLWIGTEAGLSRLKDGKLNNYPDANGRINSIVEDHDGTIWITRSRIHDDKGPLCQVIDTKVQCQGKSEKDTMPNVDLVEDSQGNLWVGSSSHPMRRDPASPSKVSWRKGPEEILADVPKLVTPPNGSVWVGADLTDRGPGLHKASAMAGPRTEPGILEPHVVRGLNGQIVYLSTVVLDHQNGIWVGTEGEGLYRIYNGQIDQFRGANGLSGDYVRRFYEDREGNFWVATTEGIDCFRNIRTISFSALEGIKTNSVHSVVASNDGTIWFGNLEALEYLRNGEVYSIQPKDGLPGIRVTSLLEDHAGRLWVGVDNGLYLYRDGRFDPIKNRDGSLTGVIISITEDRDHNIWAETLGKPGKLIRIKDFTAQEELSAAQIPSAFSLAADPTSGIWLGLESGDLARYQNGRFEIFSFKLGQDPRVHQVITMPDGSVFGATSTGVLGWKNGKRQTLTTQNALPCEGVHALIDDSQGNLWIYMQCGLVEIPNTELEKWWANGDTAVNTRTFDVFNGDRPLPASFGPKASRSSDGRLWFANGYTVQIVDPAHLHLNTMPPPVCIDGIVADQKNYSLGAYLRLPPHTRDLEIDYTGLSFVSPKDVRFRYKLEGRDTDWQEAGARRSAFYTDLSPRTYRFRVIACNNDGIWNETGATLDFSVAPAWYQTNLFLTLCIVAGLTTIYLFYLLRLRQVTAQMRSRMEERMGERERIARDLHDTLLQSVQGLILKFQAIATQIPKDQPVRQNIEKTLDYADEVVAEGRDRVRSLRDSDLSIRDLPLALQRVAEETAAGRESIVRTIVEGNVRKLHPMVIEESYCIAREALINALTHSGGSNIEAEIIYHPKQFRLRIRDDGHGIESEVLEKGGRDDHWGLRGMRERARRIGAQLNLWSRPDAGTEIELIVPAAAAYRTTRDGARTNWFRQVSGLDQ